MTVWAAVNLAVLVLKGAPPRGQLLSLLAWHLFAMFPDLLFSAAEVPHHERVRVEVWPADHLLPVRLADRLAQLLDAELLSSSR